MCIRDSPLATVTTLVILSWTAFANVPEVILLAFVVSVVAEAANPWEAIDVAAPVNFDVVIAALLSISALTIAVFVPTLPCPIVLILTVLNALEIESSTYFLLGRSSSSVTWFS